MRRRVGLAQFMAIIAVIAVGLAAMKVASDNVARWVLLGSAIALMVGFVGSLVRLHRGPWVGFSVFGWGYLLILFTPMIAPLLIPNVDSTYWSRLSIDGPVADLANWLHPDLPEPSLPFQFAMNPSSGRFERWNGQYSPLTPAESKLVDGFQAQNKIVTDRLRAESAATWIGLAFQGIAFAFLGAIVGHFLSDRSAFDTRPLT